MPEEANKPENRPGQLITRDAAGRFLAGNPGGPGRPPGAPNKRLSTAELFRLAGQVTAADIFCVALELDELEQMQERIEAADSHSPSTKAIVATLVANKRLAIMAIHQRLAAELRNT